MYGMCKVRHGAGLCFGSGRAHLCGQAPLESSYAPVCRAAGPGIVILSEGAAAMCATPVREHTGDTVRLCRGTLVHEASCGGAHSDRHPRVLQAASAVAHTCSGPPEGSVERPRIWPRSLVHCIGLGCSPTVLDCTALTAVGGHAAKQRSTRYPSIGGLGRLGERRPDAFHTWSAARTSDSPCSQCHAAHSRRHQNDEWSSQGDLVPRDEAGAGGRNRASRAAPRMGRVNPQGLRLLRGPARKNISFNTPTSPSC